jgi:hypothetical protein
MRKSTMNAMSKILATLAARPARPKNPRKPVIRGSMKKMRAQRSMEALSISVMKNSTTPVTFQAPALGWN